MRTLVLGDIHGAHRALLQVLERANFDPEQDRLISLGDVSDGWPDTAACVEELLKVRDLVAIRGNHDIWTLEYLQFGVAPSLWKRQGGQATIESYQAGDLRNDQRHLHFFQHQINLYLDPENRLYLHADFNPALPLDKQDNYNLAWGRSFWRNMAQAGTEGDRIPGNRFTDIFLGHTPTPLYIDHHEPVNFGNVWNLDQGAKIGGKLTLMDAETKEYWQSDLVSTLY